jgi:hypothetical protein
MAGTGPGSVYSISTDVGEVELAEAPAAGGPTYRFDGAEAGDAAGRGIAAVSFYDTVFVNFSGVAIGAPGADGLGRADAGTAYLIDDGAYADLDAQDGSADGVIDLAYAGGPHQPFQEAYYTLIGEAAGDGAGSTGDQSGDYLTIAAQGADGAAPGSSDAGAVYLIHGDDTERLDSFPLTSGTGSSISRSWPATAPGPIGNIGNPTSCWGRPATVWAPFCRAAS